MGISIEVFRARIGLFHHSSRVVGESTSFKQHAFNHFGLSSVCLPLGVLCILLLIGGVEPNPGPSGNFVCKYCKTAVTTTAEYSKHLIIHSHWKNFSIPCCFCKQSFKSAESFDSHVTRFHRTMRKKPASSVTLTLSCPVTSCNMVLDSRKIYMEHVSQHLQASSIKYEQAKISFTCSLGSCRSKISDKRKFQIHMSRYHPVIEKINLSKSVTAGEEVPEVYAFDDDTIEVSTTRGSTTESIAEISSSETSHGNNTSEDPYPEHIIKDDIARFYLKLEGESLIATSTVQEISLEIQRLTEYSHHCLKNTLKQQLSLLNLSESVIKLVLHNTFKSDPVFNVHHKTYDIEHLGTDFLRNKYWHQKFPFVEPREVYFGINVAGKKRIAQYVSIKETLEIMLRDKKIEEMVLQSFQRKDDPSSVLQDFYHGSGFSAHKCEHAGGNCLQLLLFQDAFDLTAFGPSAGVHKPIGFYYTLGNLPADHRSKVDLIQLAYLLLEKDIRPTIEEELDDKDILKEALSPLRDELKLLKTEGIVVGGQKVPVCLLYLIGDNLGQHTIGGFVKSFSAEFFCRFCEISKTQFLNAPYEVKPFRTPEKYNMQVTWAKKFYERKKKEALKTAFKKRLREAREHAKAGTSRPFPKPNTRSMLSKSAFNKLVAVNYKGVKYRSSPFNSAGLNFHVCSPSQPPCIAHDLFEGIFKCVIPRVLEYCITKKKWFDLKTLNRRINGFKCLGTDALDPPQPLKSVKELNRNACQNWNLVRLLPFIIGDLIKDKEDPVWKLYLLLKEVSEYICAPKISLTQVAYLKSIIRSYLDTLKALIEFFPKCLIPKQHYLAHAADLIEIFGPLIRLATLRYESKHVFFKRVARTCQNYINITYTLARKYMCKFAYDHSSGLLPEEINYSSSHILSATSCLSNEKLLTLPDNFDSSRYEFLSCVSYKRITYKEGLYVVLNSVDDTFDLIMGRIDFILIDGENNVSFLLEEKLATNSYEGYYKLESASRKTYQYHVYDDLADYYPLPAYKFGTHECISLKHSNVFM